MKEKKELTPTQQKNKYKNIKYACFGGEFLSVITPFVIIGAVNYNKYFVEYDGTRMSIACMLAMALMGIAVFLVSKKKLENSFISLIIGWYAVAFIFFLLGEIINDISTIMFIGGTGILGALGLDFASKRADKKMQKINEGIAQAEKEMTSEAYKQEVKDAQEKKTIKIKIKK